MSRTNGSGDFHTTAAKDLAAHDRCPPQLRYALNYAVNSFAAEAVLELAQSGTMPGAAIIASIRRGDARSTAETYGPTHPGAHL